METAEKDRKDTVEAVNQLDNDLLSEYILSEGDEQYVVALFQQIMETSNQGNTIQPIHFNAEASISRDEPPLIEGSLNIDNYSTSSLASINNAWINFFMLMRLWLFALLLLSSNSSIFLRTSVKSKNVEE